MLKSIPRSLVTSVSRIFPDAIFRKQTQIRAIALTFDDVGGEDTLEIIRAIDHFNDNSDAEQEKVRATFFIITDRLNDDSLTICQEILKRGHEIANHGHSDRLHASLSAVEFDREINRAHQILSQNPAVKIKWFRPGRAFYNRQMLASLQKMRDLYGYCDRFALGSLIPLDTYIENAEWMANYISQFIFPGAIIVMHGGTLARSQSTANTLTKLLVQLQAQEYRAMTLTELWESG